MKSELIQGDCLEEMPKLIARGIEFDAIIADIPYGTTSCPWDSVIPFNKYIMIQKSNRSKNLVAIYRDYYILQEIKNGRDYHEVCDYFDANAKDGMWQYLNKLIKHNGAIVLFCNEPFTSCLVHSNLKGFKYKWDWNKKIPSGMSYAKYRPMQQTEDICVFTRDGSKTVYNAQMILRNKPIKGGGMKNSNSAMTNGYKPLHKTYKYKNPTTLIEFDKIRKGSLHPTQKPVALMEYLVKTYTNEGDTVLDFTMGSNPTGKACKKLNRNYVGIEKDEDIFKIAQETTANV